MPLIKFGHSGWLQPCMEILDYGVSDVLNSLAYYDTEFITALKKVLKYGSVYYAQFYCDVEQFGQDNPCPNCAELQNWSMKSLE